MMQCLMEGDLAVPEPAETGSSVELVAYYWDINNTMLEDLQPSAFKIARFLLNLRRRSSGEEGKKVIWKTYKRELKQRNPGA